MENYSAFKHRRHYRPRMRDHNKLFPEHAVVLARIAEIVNGDLGSVERLVAHPARPKDYRLLGTGIDTLLVNCIEPSLLEEYHALRKGDHVRVKAFPCTKASSHALGTYIRGQYIGRRLESAIEESDATSGN